MLLTNARIMRLTNAKKNKEREKKEMEASNRKHLANMRVVQKNLVYVVGLSPKLAREEFIPTLKGPDYFGQYGKVAKILISKRISSHKYGHGSHDPSIGVYVTYQSKEDAARAIVAIDGSKEPGGRIIRASYGTTKYCTAYLRNMPCSNPGCTYLHEPGEEADSFTKEDLATLRHAAKDTENKIKPASMHLMPITAKKPMDSPVLATASLATPNESTEGSALPRTASWAAAGRPAMTAQDASTVIAPGPHDTQAFPGLSAVKEAAVAKAAPAKAKLARSDAALPAEIDAGVKEPAAMGSVASEEGVDTGTYGARTTSAQDETPASPAVPRKDTTSFPSIDWTLASFGDGDFTFYWPSLPTHAKEKPSPMALDPLTWDDRDASSTYTPYQGTFNPFDEQLTDAAWPSMKARTASGPPGLASDGSATPRHAAMYSAPASEGGWPTTPGSPVVGPAPRGPEEQRSAAAALLAARARQLQEAGENVPAQSMANVRTRLARQQQAQAQAQAGQNGDSQSLLALLRRIQDAPSTTDSGSGTPRAQTPVAMTPPPGLQPVTGKPNMATGLLLAQLLGTPPTQQTDTFVNMPSVP